jgi:hypothetical protein
VAKMLSKCLRSSELQWLSGRAGWRSSCAFLEHRHNAVSSAVPGSLLKEAQCMHFADFTQVFKSQRVVEKRFVSRQPKSIFNNLSILTAKHRRSAKQQHRTCATSAASGLQSVVPPDALSKLEESLAGCASISDGVKGSPVLDGRGGAKAGGTYFPYGNQFRIKEQVLSPRQVIDMLGVFMDDKRKERMAQVHT